MKRLLAAAVAVVVLALMPSVVSAGGFSQSRLDDNGWACGNDWFVGAPADHCVNPGTGNGPGQTFLIMVFDGDGGHFGSAESATTLDADARPCPHDDDRPRPLSAESPDGTWWSPNEGDLWVCHHQ